MSILSKETEFLVGIYGRLQIELIALDVVDKRGVPIKKPRKHIKQVEKDGRDIYDELSFFVKGMGAEKINSLAQYTNDVARNLINDNQTINNYLLSMYLYRYYLQEVAPAMKRGMMLPKVERTIDHYKNVDVEGFKQVCTVTSRVADNMWRVFTGKAQLSDEIRDLRAKRFIRSVA